VDKIKIPPEFLFSDDFPESLTPLNLENKKNRYQIILPPDVCYISQYDHSLTGDEIAETLFEHFSEDPENICYRVKKRGQGCSLIAVPNTYVLGIRDYFRKNHLRLESIVAEEYEDTPLDQPDVKISKLLSNLLILLLISACFLMVKARQKQSALRQQLKSWQQQEQRLKRSTPVKKISNKGLPPSQLAARLRQLSNRGAVPTLWLDEISIEPSRLQIAGRAYQSNTQDIVDYVEHIKKMPEYSNVRLQRLEKIETEEKVLLHFQIES